MGTELYLSTLNWAVHHPSVLQRRLREAHSSLSDSYLVEAPGELLGHPVDVARLNAAIEQDAEQVVVR
jgi:hypothetical protein